MRAQGVILKHQTMKHQPVQFVQFTLSYMITHNQKLVVNTKHTFLGTPPYKHEQRRCASVLLDPRWKVTP